MTLENHPGRLSPEPAQRDFATSAEMLIVMADNGPDVSGRRYFYGYFQTPTGQVRRKAFCATPDQFIAESRRPVRVFGAPK